MSQPTVSARAYAFTWIGLLLLTLLTSLLGLQDLGRMSLIVGLIIATIKASLIATFFMHALYGSKLVRVVLGGGIVWLLIFITLTLVDYVTRGWVGVPGK
jgi:cytochrome c oxidase subunit 4